MTDAQTVVAVGSSKIRDYSFLLPLTCAFWRDVIGFKPIAFLVGSETEWLAEQKTRVVVDALRSLEIDHRFVGRIDGYDDGTIAQNARQHVAALSEIVDDTWVMMADADLWPLRKGFYYRHVDRNDIKIKIKAACYYSNGDMFIGKDDVLAKYDSKLPFQSLPTCHITMRALEWRTAYGIQVDDDVTGNTKRTLDRHFAKFIDGFAGSDRGLAVWCTDQWLVTERLCRQTWFPNEVLFIQRAGHPPLDRLDRGHPGDWSLRFDQTRWVDAHLPKAPDEKFDVILPIIEALLPAHAEWARDYTAEYCKNDLC